MIMKFKKKPEGSVSRLFNFPIK
jgi:hypothetical protein